MDAYKLWVRKNRDFVQSIESLANGFTWLLPERFSNSEIGPEAVYAVLGIISAVNQHIIDTTPSRLRPLGTEELSFPWPLCLSMLKDVETVVEVAAQHFFGEEKKWNLIALTEASKVLVRLALLRDSGYKMLLQGGESENKSGASVGSGAFHDGFHDCGRPGGYYGPGTFQDNYGFVPKNLEGRAMSALNRFGQNAKLVSDPMWFDRLQRASEPSASVVEKPSLSTIWFKKGLSGQLLLTGEALFIMRPLIYVLLIRKYGVRSWFPWLLSLTVDVTSMSILTSVTRQSFAGKKNIFQASAAEKEELKRRKLIWALYIMRDPFFTKYTKDRLEISDKYLSRIPFIGFLTGKLVELVMGAQTRYTYISGS